MSKVVQISIIGKISGNVNADEVIGTRITLKKMYSSTGEVFPFVSARAIKYAIREALKKRGYRIDPFVPFGKQRLSDSGKPEVYVDNDLFGFMVAREREKIARKRQAPIALSYFKALKDTPIRAEFAGRFPRSETGESEEGKKTLPPVLFEIEVAEFVGQLNSIIYDKIGIFEEEELEEESKSRMEVVEIVERDKRKKLYKLEQEERKRRLKDFLEILLTPSYVLPRRTNSLNIPTYFGALIALSGKGPLPIYQYFDFDFEKERIDEKKLELLISRKEVNNKAILLLINYTGTTLQLPEGIKEVSLREVIEKIISFML